KLFDLGPRRSYAQAASAGPSTNAANASGGVEAIRPSEVSQGNNKSSPKELLVRHVFRRSPTSYAGMVNFQGLNMTPAELVSTISAQVKNIVGIAFPEGNHLVEMGFEGAIPLQEACDKGVTVKSVCLPVIRCFGANQKFLVATIFDTPMDNKEKTE